MKNQPAVPLGTCIIKKIGQWGSEMKGKLVEVHRERFKGKNGGGGGGGVRGGFGWGGSLDPDDWNQDVRRLKPESSHRVRERE